MRPPKDPRIINLSWANRPFGPRVGYANLSAVAIGDPDVCDSVSSNAWYNDFSRSDTLCEILNENFTPSSS